jgi:hypothetical protein
MVKEKIALPFVQPTKYRTLLVVPTVTIESSVLNNLIDQLGEMLNLVSCWPSTPTVVCGKLRIRVRVSLGKHIQ